MKVWVTKDVSRRGSRKGPPGWTFVSHAAAVGTYAYTQLIRHTVRRETIDEARLPPDRSAIYCIWHSDAFSYLMFFLPEHRIACMVGDSWKIEFLRICGDWLGARGYVLGQSGRGGREASERVIDYLRDGISTAVTPDGPRGPNRKIQRGILHMAARSGAPIVVINLTPNRRWRFRNQWDDKWLPIPFSHTRIRLHEPLYITEHDLDDVEGLEEVLYERLGV